jgi:hypothetical protein
MVKNLKLEKGPPEIFKRVLLNDQFIADFKKYEIENFTSSETN